VESSSGQVGLAEWSFDMSFFIVGLCVKAWSGLLASIGFDGVVQSLRLSQVNDVCCSSSWHVFASEMYTCELQNIVIDWYHI
jgi:hypothetical protein